jgi:hypothetical protein
MDRDEENAVAKIEGMVGPAGRKLLKMRETPQKIPPMSSCGNGVACAWYV